MIVTTIAALSWQAFEFFTGETPNYFLGNLSIILIIMAMFVSYEGFSAFYKLHEKSKEIVVEA